MSIAGLGVLVTPGKPHRWAPASSEVGSDLWTLLYTPLTKDDDVRRTQGTCCSPNRHQAPSVSHARDSSLLDSHQIQCMKGKHSTTEMYLQLLYFLD